MIHFKTIKTTCLLIITIGFLGTAASAQESWPAVPLPINSEGASITEICAILVDDVARDFRDYGNLDATTMLKIIDNVENDWVDSTLCPEKNLLIQLIRTTSAVVIMEIRDRNARTANSHVGAEVEGIKRFEGDLSDYTLTTLPYGAYSIFSFFTKPPTPRNRLRYSRLLRTHLRDLLLEEEEEEEEQEIWDSLRSNDFVSFDPTETR